MEFPLLIALYGKNISDASSSFFNLAQAGQANQFINFNLKP